MRQMALLSALTIGLQCLGCGIGHLPLGWVIKGELVDAATGEKLGNADVSIRLFREDESLGDDGNGSAGADGTFETYVLEGFSGTIVLPIFTQPPAPLGDAPDQIEILVRTPTQEGFVTVPVDPTAVTRPDRYNGEIQVSVLTVELGPRKDAIYQTSGSLSSVGLGDVDSDGDIDMVATTYDHFFGPDLMTILANNGDGTFDESDIFGVGDSPNWIVVAHLNEDAHSDLAVIQNDSKELLLLMNDGQGKFGHGVPHSIESIPGGPLVTADFNGDSLLDLAWASPVEDGFSVHLNMGAGRFGVPSTYPAGEAPVSVVAADLDGDGDLDIVVANRGDFIGGDPGGISTVFNSGDGMFKSGQSYAAGNGPRSLVAGDLDGDGDADLAVQNTYSDDISILSNAGDGTFVAGATYPIARLFKLAAADLNDDDHLDLIALERGILRNVIILANNGDGTFRDAVRLSAGADPDEVVVGYLDEDTHLDILVSSRSNRVSVFLNPQIPEP